MHSQSDYFEYDPSTTLKPVIEAFWQYKPDLQSSVRDILIPEGNIDIVFNYGAAYERTFLSEKECITNLINKDSIIGQRTHLFEVTWPKNTKLFAIRLKTDSAHRLLDCPLHTFSNSSLSITETPVAPLSDLLHQCSFTDSNKLIERAEMFLEDLMRSRPPEDKRLTSIINILNHHNGNIDLSSLLATASCSRRTLERLFSNKVGLTPKAYCRILRLNHFLYLYQTRATKSFTEVANHSDFYDQSHFIKEFKAFTGQNPSQFFKSPPKIYSSLMASLMNKYKRTETNDLR